MSARFSTAFPALAALFGLLWYATAASAKPPDLPEDQEVICAPYVPAQAAVAPTAVPTQVEVDVAAAAAWCNALRAAQRCLLCGAHPLLVVLPVPYLLGEDSEEAAAALLTGQAGENTEQDTAPSEEAPSLGAPVSPPQGMAPRAVRPVQPKKDGFTCPYLREEEARQHRTQPCPLATPSDVLGNLHKLQEAGKAVDLGNYYRDTGHPDSAAFYYERARHLCPGSRYERLAQGELSRLQTNRATGNAEEDQDRAAHRVRPGQSGKGGVEQFLRSPINVNFNDTPLRQALEGLGDSRGINIILDRPALDAEGVCLDRPITIRLEQVAGRTALNLMLRQARLAYKVEDNVILVTTEAAAQPKPITCTYEVGDILANRTFLTGSVGTGIAATETPQRRKVPEERLMGLIVSAINPQSWNAMGGAGTIDYYPLSRALVITQRPDMQEQVADLLAALRRLNGEQGRAATPDNEGAPHDAADHPTDEDQSCAPATDNQIGDLLKACQRALHAGQYAKAEGLARSALALDGDAVVAHPLVYKQHLLTNLAAKVGHPIVVCSGMASEPEDQTPQQAHSSCSTAEVLARITVLCKQGLYAEAERCALEGLAHDPGSPALAAAAQMAAMHCRMKASPADSPSCPPGVLRHPDLPPVDPDLPAAMDKILTTVGEPAEEKLQITVEESGGTAEESEPADTDEPDPYRPPSESKPAGTTSDQGSAPGGPEWLRDLVDLLRSSACAEVEGRPGASRGCCRVPVGCMTGEVSWDSRGEHGSFTLKLGFFDTPDRGACPYKEEATKP
jgi:hypothetical protein